MRARLVAHVDGVKVSAADRVIRRQKPP